MCWCFGFDLLGTGSGPLIPPIQYNNKKQVGLLVLDSVGFPFRQDTVFQTESPLNTARTVGLMARELCRMAQDRGLAVRG